MKRTKFIEVTALVLAVFFTFSLSQAFAGMDQDDFLVQEYVVVSPGSEEEVNFYIDDAFDMREFGPMAVFIVMAAGQSGTLSIELIIDPDEELELEFTDVIKGMLVGMGLSLEPSFTFISGDSVEVPVNSVFGFAVFGAIIIKKDTLYPMRKPVPCRIVFELSE